jgi:hypothetical protein
VEHVEIEPEAAVVPGLEPEVPAPRGQEARQLGC